MESRSTNQIIAKLIIFKLEIPQTTVTFFDGCHSCSTTFLANPSIRIWILKIENSATNPITHNALTFTFEIIQEVLTLIQHFTSEV